MASEVDQFTPRVKSVSGHQADWVQSAIAASFRASRLSLEGIQEPICVQGQGVVRRHEIFLLERGPAGLKRIAMHQLREEVRSAALPAVGALLTDDGYMRCLQSLLLFEFPWIAQAASKPAGAFVNVIHRPYASFIWESCPCEQADERLRGGRYRDGVGLFLVNKELSSHTRVMAVAAIKALVETVNDMERPLIPGRKIRICEPASL